MKDVEVAALLCDKEKRAGVDYIIVDFRRTDFGVLSDNPQLLIRGTIPCDQR